MKHSRLLFAFIAAGCAGSSFAQYTSPELMLVTDAGGTTPAGTTAPAQIERYDPYTGAYLGAFGAGYVTDPFGVTVIGADAYVTDSFTVGTTPYSRIDKFNFSTGAYDGTIFSSSPDFLTGVTTYGSYLLASDFGSGGLNGGIYTYNSSGAQTNFYGMPQNSEPLSIATDASHVYVSSYQGLYSYNLNSSGVPTGLVFNASASSILFGVLYDGAKNSVYASGYSTINEYNTSGSIVSTYSN
ncbi:MAG TPA: hypothetical protein VMI31_11260, partial [Fimbriimonadaceae bacterium]|nr:hypothetical protein [Fimbriimonadaceae bacterium]